MRQELPHYRGAAPVVGYSMQNGVLICSELPGEILPEAPKALDRGIPTRRTPIISDCRRETVRKGLLGERLGTLPSMRRAYQTDLSDAEWSYIEPHLPTSEASGRPRMHTLREIVDAIFYIVRSGCAWRLLPHDFPPWKTVHHYFRTWRIDGTWQRMHSAQRSHRGQPVHQDHGRGRKGAWLRRRQEDQGAQAPPPGGHAGFGARSAGS